MYMEVQYTWMMWKMLKFLEAMFSEITMPLKRAALLTLIAQQIKTMTLHNVLWKYQIQSFMAIQLFLTEEPLIGIYLSLQCHFKNQIFKITKPEFTVMILQESLKGWSRFKTWHLCQKDFYRHPPPHQKLKMSKAEGLYLCTLSSLTSMEKW